MTFLCRGMVWGVDWIHLVGVGVGIKKHLVQGWTKAQSWGWRERRYFRVGGKKTQGGHWI